MDEMKLPTERGAMRLSGRADADAAPGAGSSLGGSPVAADEVIQREAGLHRGLTARQIAMIGLGCTIGTGLFLGSAISVKLAGPAVYASRAPKCTATVMPPRRR